MSQNQILSSTMSSNTAFTSLVGCKYERQVKKNGWLTDQDKHAKRGMLAVCNPDYASSAKVSITRLRLPALPGHCTSFCLLRFAGRKEKRRHRRKMETSSFRGKGDLKKYWLKSTHLREIEGLFCHCNVPPFELISQILCTGVNVSVFVSQTHPKYRPCKCA